MAETRSRLQPLLAADPVEWSAAAPPPPPPPSSRFHSGSLRSAKGGGSWGAFHTSLPGAARRGAPCPREPLGGFPSAAPPFRLSPPPTSAARPRFLPPAPRPKRAHRGSGTWARGRQRQLLPLPEPKPEPETARSPSHAAGSAAAFRSASARSPAPRAPRASEAAEGRTRTEGRARRAGASRTLKKGRRQPGGGSPAPSLALGSSRSWGFQAAMPPHSF